MGSIIDADWINCIGTDWGRHGKDIDCVNHDDI